MNSDNDGFYRFTGLRAGDYTVVEEHPTDWLDGTDAAGTIDSIVVGTAINPGDRIEEVSLKWGDQGFDYDFGELQPSRLSGRVHLYEGGNAGRTAFYVRVMGGLGVRILFLSNAAGAIREDWQPGELMLLTDHINLTGNSPLIGPVVGAENRFPDMTVAYDADLCDIVRAAAAQQGMTLNEFDVSSQSGSSGQQSGDGQGSSSGNGSGTLLADEDVGEETGNGQARVSVSDSLLDTFA